MKAFFIALLLPGLALAADSAPARLTLAQAEAIALRNAPSIAAAYYAELSAGEVVTQARASYFPQVTADAEAIGTGNDIENTLGGGDHVAAVQTRIGASGGLNTPTVLSRMAFGAGLSQLLLDFGHTSNAVDAARFNSLSAHDRTLMAREQVLAVADQAYYRVLSAQAVLNVARDTVKSRQLLYDQVSALAKSRLKSSLDVTVANTKLQQAQLLLLQSQNNLDQSFAELSAALGYRELHRFECADEPTPAAPPVNADALIAQAFRLRPELAALQAGRDALVKQSYSERDSLLPTISAIGTIGTEPVRDPAMAPNYAAAGINIELPIFDGGRIWAKYRESSYRARAADRDLADLEDRIARDVNGAWLNAGTAYKKIEVSQALYKSASDSFSLAQARYKSGTISIIELSQAELDMIQAEIDSGAARYDFDIATALLNYQTGALGSNLPGIISPYPAHR